VGPSCRRQDQTVTTMCVTKMGDGGVSMLTMGLWRRYLVRNGSEPPPAKVTPIRFRRISWHRGAKMSERKLPRRRIGKQDAIRHLIHSAVRLIMKMDDPFALHLIIQSVEKLLIDVAAGMNKYLEMDWELCIKDEYHGVFFKQYRETYNFLKHAKSDFEKELPVRDIMMMNVMGLFMCIVNYAKLYDVHSDHMRLFTGFVQVLMPKMIKAPAELRPSVAKALDGIGDMTPATYFQMFQEFSLLPKLREETSIDLQDILEFYGTPLRQLQHAFERPK
jgi:hypothetical protein